MFELRKRFLSLRERLWFLKSAIQVLFQRTIETYDTDTNTKMTEPLPVRDRLDIAWSCFETFLLGFVYELDEGETISIVLEGEGS